MSPTKTRLAVVLAGMLVLSVLAPVGAAVATEDDSNGQADDEASSSLGQLLSQFFGTTDKHDVDGPFGLAVADFVHEHSPGNAADNAGTPDDVGDGERGQSGDDHGADDEEDDDTDEEDDDASDDTDDEEDDESDDEEDDE